MGQKRERPKIKIVAHLMQINGETVAIDPYKTDLPDRCKLVLAETFLGNKYRLTEKVSSS